MNKKIKKYADNIQRLYEYKYGLLEDNILYIINNNIKDIKIIEYYLDSVLDIPIYKANILFKKLCDYYKSINNENAIFYENEYKKIYILKE